VGSCSRAIAANRNVDSVAHPFIIGRHTGQDPRGYLEELQSVVWEERPGDVVTVFGRYSAMDCNRNRNRTNRGFDTIED
jgi:bisphosphoglycerate-independent phosphoglycerate mutase (AlkP superfamily)